MVRVFRSNRPIYGMPFIGGFTLFEIMVEVVIFVIRSLVMHNV